MQVILAKLTYFLTDFKYYLLFFIVSLFISFFLLYLTHKKALSKKHTNLFLVLISTFLSLVAIFTLGEAYFRYIYDQSDGIGYLKVNQKWHQRHLIVNSNFRRDNEFIFEKQPGEYRIALIGDSIAFGMGIANPQDRFPDLLENRLQQDGFNAQLYNLGMSGANTDSEIKDYHQMEDFDFDLILWQYFLNDINTGTQSASTKIILNNIQNRLKRFPLLRNIVDSSFLADFFYWRFTSIYDQTFQDLINENLKLYSSPYAFPGHQAQIQEFLKQQKQRNIKIIVILFPLLHSEVIRQQTQSIYDQMISVFTSGEATAVINLASVLQKYPIAQIRASRFDHHPNEFVHQITAKLLYSTVKQLIKKK